MSELCNCLLTVYGKTDDLHATIFFQEKSRDNNNIEDWGDFEEFENWLDDNECTTDSDE